MEQIKKKKLASFDIFDTVLIRKCGSPENIFYLLSRRIYGSREEAPEVRDAFFLWRSRAENDAVYRLGKGNVTLEDIYGSLDAGTLPEGMDVAAAMALEKRTEADNLVANLSVRNEIAARRKAGFRIVFISDMYLDGAFLKEVLVREGCADPGDEVYVSNEYDATKACGRLFDIVKDKEGPLEDWVHYGDNTFSDIRMSARRGIRPVLVDTGSSASEDYFRSVSMSQPYFHDCSVLAGMQRAARLVSGDAPEISGAVDLIASSYIPYVEWIFRKASEKGIRRLYFLARDGYMLKEIAEELSPAYPGIELRYLYVSRFALFLPSLYTLSREEFYGSCGFNPESFYPLLWYGYTVKKLLYMLRTTKEELGPEFCSVVNFDKFTSREQEDIFFKALEIPRVKKKILESAAAQRRLLKAYFIQEGLGGGKMPSATVDVGWVGSSRLIMNRILKREGMSGCYGFYFGCSVDMLPPKYGDYMCYYGSSLLKACPPGLFEHYFSSASHPTTIGYEEKSGKVHPVFGAGPGPGEIRQAKMRTEVVRTVARYVFEGGLGSFSPEAMRFWGGTYLDIYNNIRCRLDYSFLAALDTFPDMQDSYRLVRRLSVREISRFFRKGYVRNVIFPRLSLYYTCGIRVPDNGLPWRRQEHGRWFNLKMNLKYRRRKLWKKCRF